MTKTSISDCKRQLLNRLEAGSKYWLDLELNLEDPKNFPCAFAAWRDCLHYISWGNGDSFDPDFNREIVSTVTVKSFHQVYGISALYNMSTRAIEVGLNSI